MGLAISTRPNCESNSDIMPVLSLTLVSKLLRHPCQVAKLNCKPPSLFLSLSTHPGCHAHPYGEPATPCKPQNDWFLPLQPVRLNYSGYLHNVGNVAKHLFDKVKQMHKYILSDAVMSVKVVGGLRSEVGCIEEERGGCFEGV